MNLVNAIGSIYIIDQFSAGEHNYGSRNTEFNRTDEAHQFSSKENIFLRVTKLVLLKYSGSSKSMESYDMLCVTPLDTFNKMIFVVLRVWFIVLMIFTCQTLGINILLTVMPSIRKMILARSYDIGSPQWASEFIEKTNVNMLFRELQYGMYS